jgi:hypothetical protein
MKAKEAAEWVNQHQDCEEEEVKRMIPVYTNDLPRRGWLETFKNHLSPQLLKRFADLK